jgi:hypothetical protein
VRKNRPREYRAADCLSLLVDRLDLADDLDYEPRFDCIRDVFDQLSSMMVF